MNGGAARNGTRRTLIAGSLSAALIARPGLAAGMPFADLEDRIGGRLGVHALNTATGKVLGHRASERFALCSTFKFLLALQVQARIEAGLEQADRTMAFDRRDLVSYSPALEKKLYVGRMSVADLIQAILELSDNGAANLLLRTQGGPAGLTAFLRTHGDTVTRLDRIEPELNSALPGDLRDTTSPQAMTGTLKALLDGKLLSPSGQKTLLTSMTACRTGMNRLRKDLPAGWLGADKTGTGQRWSTNDVAILWPPNRKPILVSAYLTETKAPIADREAVLAEVAGRVIKILSHGQA